MVRKRVPLLVLAHVAFHPDLRRDRRRHSCALYSLYLLFRSFRKGPRALFVSLAGILLFTGLFAVLYASSHFAAIATPRYFLPMVAPIAVLLGVAVVHTSNRIPLLLALIPVLILIGVQISVFSWAAAFERSAASQMKRIEILGDFLGEQGIDTLYTVPLTIQ